MNILLVEDRPEDAFLVKKQLAREAGDSALDIEHVETLTDALERIQQDGIDCVLLDLGLPDGRGLNNLRRIQSTAPKLPVVILSGVEDERTAASAVQTGAFAYLVKRPIGQAEALLPVLQDAVSAQESGSNTIHEIHNFGEMSLDADGIICSWNSGATQVLHWQADDIIGKALTECVPASRRDELTNALHNAPTSSEALKLHMLLPNGRARLVELQPANETDDAGNRVWKIVDAETSRQSLQALQVLDVIMEKVSDSVFSQDLDGAIHSCSQSMAAVTGRSPEELIGARFSDLVPPSERGAAEAILQALRRGRVIRDLDLALLGPGDKSIPVVMTLAPLRDEYGGLIGACTIATPRTVSDETSSAVVREKLRMEEMNAMLMDEVDQLRGELRRLRQAQAEG